MEKEATEECIDENPSCLHWASIGECSTNPGYMLGRCKLSCGVRLPKPPTAPEECADDYDQCPGWASAGECAPNPNMMLKGCKLSCTLCDGTEGCSHFDDAKCELWASQEECQQQPSKMIPDCAKACKACEVGCKVGALVSAHRDGNGKWYDGNIVAVKGEWITVRWKGVTEVTSLHQSRVKSENGGCVCGGGTDDPDGAGQGSLLCTTSNPDASNAALTIVFIPSNFDSEMNAFEAQL